MAGKISAKNAVISVDDSTGGLQNISKDCVSFEIEQDAGKLDITGFTEGSVNFIPGMPVYGVKLDVKWNSTATTGARTVLQGIFLSTTSKTVTVVPEVGGQGFSGEFMLDALPVSGTPVGDLVIGSVHFSVFGATAPTWST
jgi:hypothetical protein